MGLVASQHVDLSRTRHPTRACSGQHGAHRLDCWGQFLRQDLHYTQTSGLWQTVLAKQLSQKGESEGPKGQVMTYQGHPAPKCPEPSFPLTPIPMPFSRLCISYLLLPNDTRKRGSFRHIYSLGFSSGVWAQLGWVSAAAKAGAHLGGSTGKGLLPGPGDSGSIQVLVDR